MRLAAAAGIEPPALDALLTAGALAAASLAAASAAGALSAVGFASAKYRAAAALCEPRSSGALIAGRAWSSAGNTIAALQFGHLAVRPAHASLLLTNFPQ